MADDYGFPDPRSRGGIPWPAALGAIVAFGLLALWFGYAMFVFEVPQAHMAVMIHKTGRDLPNDREIAPGPEYKGVQRQVLTEGRYTRNPYSWDWEIVPQVEIEEGEMGVVVSLTGDDLPYGEFLAKLDENGTPTTKGIMPGVLRVGRYPLNPYAFTVRKVAPITVPAGYKGVVTDLAGPIPEEPNVMLVPDGFRGVQQSVLDEGTHYVNPFQKRIDLIDTRSQRFNLAEKKDMGFPSKDGFWVSLDGIIEFRVKPELASEVYVTYNETDNGSTIGEEIIRKVILPNARSFCRLEGSNKSGRDFITGDTRIQFEQEFEQAMRDRCEPQGIEIVQAVITAIRPPQKIAEPVREREIAIRNQENFLRQIALQEQRQREAIQEELLKQKQALVQAEQEVVKLTTDAEQKQQVALTKANERKGVADFRLKAAEDEAAAIVARGKADAQVVEFENEAEAAGWKEAVAAFSGDGGEYARYVMYQKMAVAYRRIMVNTADSPLVKIFESFTPGGTSASLAEETPKSDQEESETTQPVTAGKD